MAMQQIESYQNYALPQPSPTQEQKPTPGGGSNPIQNFANSIEAADARTEGPKGESNEDRAQNLDRHLAFLNGANDEEESQHQDNKDHSKNNSNNSTESEQEQIDPNQLSETAKDNPSEVMEQVGPLEGSPLQSGVPGTEAMQSIASNPEVSEAAEFVASNPEVLAMAV